MRVYITVDIEGIAGVVHSQEGSPGNPEYERARRLMTQEANDPPEHNTDHPRRDQQNREAEGLNPIETVSPVPLQRSLRRDRLHQAVDVRRRGHVGGDVERGATALIGDLGGGELQGVLAA